ncbi:penicillin acylase family protein [Roseateles cellulosilyticus]|uniref:Penicillin acylase family protein n=1 Tax=Pelomonas cellulosilytica TaxID=2906762 RepID=A0ABS8XZD3_9BURK|nr:penicillin acylase family protein [Pelomonas sp. P8]MCE4556630.1 penicillin acylase family protein [Pelomonas sp. P8]
MARRATWVWLRRGLVALLAIALLLALVVWLLLRASLAQLDGEHTVPMLSAPVDVQRDERGYVSVLAESRTDVARALGFVHAQERFFQMDLMRRNAAGELSALVGAMALPLDRARRVHRFRHRAVAALAALPRDERELLDAYTAGVNAGLAALGARPPEYLLLRQRPLPWAEEDSLLVAYGMYLDLQSAQGRDDLAMGVLHDAVPADWYAFLSQHSADWQAALDDSRVAAVPVPAGPMPAALRSTKTACSDCRLQDARDLGSNNFAVAAAHGAEGRALLADDMHLGLRSPGTWFKARMVWKDGAGGHDIAGVTLPGAPLLVVGSNGRVAWGFTNTTSDWADVVTLQLDAAGTHYRSGGVDKPLRRSVERIEVAGGEAVEQVVRDSEWGPVLDLPSPPSQAYALRWVAHDPEGMNLRLFHMETAGSVDDAVQRVAGAGMPAQNLLVADASGRIAWTIIGAIPRRVGLADAGDMDRPQDWSDGRPRWQGYLSPAEQPRVVDPADGRLWTANARMVGGEAMKLLGNGGWDLGARAMQIRDDLRAQQRFDEASLHAIQLDHRALLLQRWRRLLLDQVLTPEFVTANGLADYRAEVVRSADAARPDAVGYLLVRSFREQALQSILAPLAALMEVHGLKLHDLKIVPETPGWALIQAARPDTLPGGHASWQALLQRAVLDSRRVIVERHGRLASWGQDNPTNMRHPLSPAVPVLAGWLDQASQGMAGDSHMPRVHNHGHGQSERMVVSPGHEELGILVIPGGQSGHPMSPFYRSDHAAWLAGEPLPFLPGPAQHRLVLRP